MARLGCRAAERVSSERDPARTDPPYCIFDNSQLASSMPMFEHIFLALTHGLLYFVSFKRFAAVVRPRERLPYSRQRLFCVLLSAGHPQQRGNANDAITLDRAEVAAIKAAGDVGEHQQLPRRELKTAGPTRHWTRKAVRP